MLSATTMTLLASLASLSRVERQVNVAVQRSGNSQEGPNNALDKSQRIIAEAEHAQARIGNAVMREAFETWA